MCASIILFTSCTKDEETSADIRDQIVGEYTVVAAAEVENLSTGDIQTIPAAPGSMLRCEKSGSSNINLILEEFIDEGEDLIIPCNQVTEVAGGLTFHIIETDGIDMENFDGSSGPPWILNGIDNPQSYSSDDGIVFHFEMENGQYMYTVNVIGINNN